MKKVAVKHPGVQTSATGNPIFRMRYSKGPEPPAVKETPIAIRRTSATGSGTDRKTRTGGK